MTTKTLTTKTTRLAAEAALARLAVRRERIAEQLDAGEALTWRELEADRARLHRVIRATAAELNITYPEALERLTGALERVAAHRQLQRSGAPALVADVVRAAGVTLTDRGARGPSPLTHHNRRNGGRS